MKVTVVNKQIAINISKCRVEGNSKCFILSLQKLLNKFCFTSNGYKKESANRGAQFLSIGIRRNVGRVGHEKLHRCYLSEIQASLKINLRVHVFM